MGKIHEHVGKSQENIGKYGNIMENSMKNHGTYEEIIGNDGKIWENTLFTHGGFIPLFSH